MRSLLALTAFALMAQPTDATSFSWDKFQAAAKEEAAKMEKAAKIAGSKVAEEATVGTSSTVLTRLMMLRTRIRETVVTAPVVSSTIKLALFAATSLEH